MFNPSKFQALTVGTNKKIQKNTYKPKLKLCHL